MNDTIETLKARIAELEASDAHNERRWRNEEAAKRQVMGYRDEWRDRAEAAETRLANLSAPAEGVDPLEVLRRAEMLEAVLGVPAAERTTEQRRDRDVLYAHQAAAAPALARALIAARADLDDMEGERDAARNAEEQAVKVANAASGAMMQAEGERDSARARADLIMLESVKATREVCAAANRAIEERDAARAEVEEARLTLAAEQGKPEGAPSEGWTCPPGTVYWQRRSESPLGTWAITPTSPQEREGHPGWRWRATFIDLDGRRSLLHESTARAPMLAADAAVKESP